MWSKFCVALESIFITKFGTIELFILILDILPLYTSIVAVLWHYQSLVYSGFMAYRLLDLLLYSIRTHISWMIPENVDKRNLYIGIIYTNLEITLIFL